MIDRTRPGPRGGFRRALAWLIAAAVLPAAAGPAPALPPELVGYDPAGQVRFATPAQADAKRQQLIQYIWPAGLPGTVPAVTPNVGAAALAGDLSAVAAGLVGSVHSLDADVGGFDFHSLSYLIEPASPAAAPRLAVVHQGHQGGIRDGIDDTVNTLLGEGFHVVAMQMPLVGWNLDNTVRLPGGAIVTIDGRSVYAHNDLFAQLAPPTLPDGAPFRLFLEPIVQNINLFLAQNPTCRDVAMIGLSGGGWTTHMAAAVDARIDLSVPVAGSLPLYARPYSPGSAGDAEQEHEPLYREIDSDDADAIPDTADGVASWLEVYALGGYGPGRRQIQVLNLYDSCCFGGDVFETYDDFLRQLVDDLGQGEWDFVSDTTHTSHKVSTFTIDNVIAPALIPEPASAALLALAGLCALLRRPRRS